MEYFIITMGIVGSLFALYLNALATFAIRYDHSLEKVQKIGQMVFVWLIPFLGASFVLHLVFDHSPEAIPKSWIPWPFKSLIYGKSIKSNRNRDDNEVDAISGRNNSKERSGEGGDGD